jgi:hypothetical protein
VRTCYQAGCDDCGFYFETAGLNAATELERAVCWAVQHYLAPVPGQPDYVCDSSLIAIVRLGHNALSRERAAMRRLGDLRERINKDGPAHNDRPRPIRRETPQMNDSTLPKRPPGVQSRFSREAFRLAAVAAKLRCRTGYSDAERNVAIALELLEAAQRKLDEMECFEQLSGEPLWPMPLPLFDERASN